MIHFQGSKLPSPIGNLVLSPIQPQLQLSLLRTAAVGETQNEIAHAIREVNPGVTRDLIGNLKVINSISTNLGVASAMFTKNKLKYISSTIYNWNLFDTHFFSSNLYLKVKRFIYPSSP